MSENFPVCMRTCTACDLRNACCFQHAESMLSRVFWPVDTISGPQRPVGHLIRMFWQVKHNTSGKVWLNYAGNLFTQLKNSLLQYFTFFAQNQQIYRNDSDSCSGIFRNIRRTIPKIFTSECEIFFKNIPFNWKSNTFRNIVVTLKISLYPFCFLLFSYETYWKCRKNYSNSFGGISKNILCIGKLTYA